ncbi:MAG: GNAT family N-acetyltransferase, partial [Chthoniobacterales bacterium]
ADEGADDETVPAADTGAATPSPLAIAEIKRMYVAPEARGRGLAAAILERLEDWARTHGYTRVQLETGGRQPIAIRLYERFGYARIPCYAHHAADPLAVCFEKQLEPR